MQFGWLNGNHKLKKRDSLHASTSCVWVFPLFLLLLWANAWHQVVKSLQQRQSHTYTHSHSVHLWKCLSTPPLGNLHSGNVKIHGMSWHCCWHFITVFPATVTVAAAAVLAPCCMHENEFSKKIVKTVNCIRKGAENESVSESRWREGAAEAGIKTEQEQNKWALNCISAVKCNYNWNQIKGKYNGNNDAANALSGRMATREVCACV